jgi:hypothetical protein
MFVSEQLKKLGIFIGEQIVKSFNEPWGQPIVHQQTIPNSTSCLLMNNPPLAPCHAQMLILSSDK